MRPAAGGPLGTGLRQLPDAFARTAGEQAAFEEAPPRDVYFGLPARLAAGDLEHASRYRRETAVGSGVSDTMGVMTTREKFDRLVDQLSEPSLKAEYARLLREREIDRQVVESYERTPQFEPDGWSDLEKVHKSSRRAVLGRLDEEERAAGHELR